MKKSKKITLSVLLFLLLCAAYGAYLCIHYIFYMEYQKYLTGYTYEAGKELKAENSGAAKVNGMVLAAENDFLQLYTNTRTTEVAVYDKRSGEITYSNPVDRDKDPLADGRNKTALNSQFMLTYYDSSMTEITMYNYDYSVEKNQVSMESIKDGIRYTYLCGNLESPTGLAPPYITAKRLKEKILDKLSEKEAKTIKNNYVESKSLPGFLELTKGARASKVGLSKMNRMLENAGYTQADFEEEAKEASGGTMPERTTFTIPLEYRLWQDKLIVTIPAEKIQETGSGRLVKIDLLSYFGAGGIKEEGYLLVPNGSGSLIYFNNGKKAEAYNQYLYGMDPSLQSYTVVEHTEEARLPVFGIKHPDSAIFAEITEGDTLANITANVSGGVNSYNYVYPSFLIRGSEKVSMFGAEGVNADLPVLEKKRYPLNLTVSYSFLEKQNASYSGMANYYRAELIEKGVLKRNQKADSIPFYLDLVGGVKKQESFLGIPCRKVYPMTTFQEAMKIVNAFQEHQVSNLRVNYLGWFNGGYYHDAAKKIKVERELGGRGKLALLNKMLEEKGAKLFGDAAFQKVSFLSEDYNYKMESAQYYSGYLINLGRVNPVTLRQTGGLNYFETNYFIVSPKFLVRHIKRFSEAIKQVPIAGISLRDLGDTLAADKRRTNVINREQAKQVVLGQLAILKETTGRMMIQRANGYALRFASDIADIPAGHNPFFLVDEEIPFYQMVIHGYIDYCGGSINLNGSFNRNDILLHALEFGLSPHFTLSFKESSIMKYTGLNSLYSTQYTIWLLKAADLYKELNRVLCLVTDSAITEHKILAPEVKKIAYDNGCVIYINYGKESICSEGVVIPAEGYAVKEKAVWQTSAAICNGGIYE